MARFPYDVVGFDLDGTLFDTGDDLAAAVNHALAAGGRLPLANEEIRRMIGGGARTMLARAMAATGGCEEAQLDALLPRLTAYYAEHLVVHTCPYPGAIDALEALAGSGVTLGIMTNKREGFSMALLEAFGIANRFAAVIGGDTLGVGKPDPEPIHEMVRRCGGGGAAFVGDSRYDVEAAHAAGLPAVAVSFGYRQEPVDALGADAVIDRFDQLLGALREVAAR